MSFGSFIVVESLKIGNLRSLNRGESCLRFVKSDIAYYFLSCENPQVTIVCNYFVQRCMFEREQKFAIIRSKMLKKGEVAEPVRKAKLAYVEPVGGPRFNRQKAATVT